MRTLDLYSCDNKGADQLYSICTTDQRLCFHYSASTIPLHVTWLYVTCNVQPSQATANPVDGKACSSAKGGLLRYIPNTYSIHKVSSLKFSYFQRKLSRYMIKMYRYKFFTVFDLISALVPKIAHPDRFRKTCSSTSTQLNWRMDILHQIYTLNRIKT